MKTLNRREPVILLLGDLFFFVLSLWLALFVRAGFDAPSKALFFTHFKPFSLLFLVWIVVFYIAGLYEKHTVLLRSRLPIIIANTQFANAALAVIFFYIVPLFGITPKTILFIYLVLSFVFISLWRMYGYFLVGQKKPEKAIIIGSGAEMRELYEEVNHNPLFGLEFVTSVDLDRADEAGFWDEIVSRIYAENVSIVAIDLMHARVEPVLPHLYNLIFSRVTFVDMHKIYEDVFKRVPLSLVRYNWFLENISVRTTGAYDALKRLMDIVLAGIGGLASLVFYPFVILAIKLDDGGPIFISQARVGRHNKIVKIHKFRTMSGNDSGYYEGGATQLAVTRAGAFLRNSRIDELPQLWNVLRGDISLIGPRPELPALVSLYEKEIPYYKVRHILKPGLSGWAQIYQENHPHHGEAVLETKEKLSYDLYYIKNHSFLLDVKIVLRTIRTVFSRAGR